MSGKAIDGSSSTLQDDLMSKRRDANRGLWLTVKVLLIVVPLYCLQYGAEKYQGLRKESATTSVLESRIGTLTWFKCEEPVAPGMDCGLIV